MLNIKDTCNKAYAYFNDMGITGLCSIKDIGDSLVFEGGNPNVTNYGIKPIAINKETGEIEVFEPEIENLKLLIKAKQIDIPKEYEFKAS